MNKRDIILVALPFTDLTETKVRPALVLADLEEDLLCCFISSNIQNKSKNDILVPKDQNNHLKTDSLIKCAKLFTIHSDLIDRRIGSLDKTTYSQVIKRLMNLVS